MRHKITGLDMKYKTVTKEDPLLSMDPEDFCIVKSIDVKIGVKYEAQVDGRGWYDEEVDEETENLIDDIMKDVRKDVSAWVVKNDPYKPFRCGRSRPKLYWYVVSLNKDNKIQSYYFRKDEVSFNEWFNTKEKATKFSTKEEALRQCESLSQSCGRGAYTIWSGYDN